MNASLMVLLALMAAVPVSCAKTTSACGGHRLFVEYIRNCRSENVIELSENFTISLNDKCQLHFDGCITTHADITSAEITYIVEKEIVKISGTRDICSRLEHKSDEIERVLELLGLPKQCPIKKGVVCFGHKSINLTKYKSQMYLLDGSIVGKSLIITNSGKSCIELSTIMTYTIDLGAPIRNVKGL